MARVPSHSRGVRRHVLRRVHARRGGGLGGRIRGRPGRGPRSAREPAPLGEPHGVVVGRQPVEPRRLLPEAQPLSDHPLRSGGVRAGRTGVGQSRRDRRRAGGPTARPAPRPHRTGRTRRHRIRPRRRRRSGRRGAGRVRPPRALHHRADAVLRRTQPVAEPLRPRRRRGPVLRRGAGQLRGRAAHRDRAHDPPDSPQPGAGPPASPRSAGRAAVRAGGPGRGGRTGRAGGGAQAGRHQDRRLGPPGRVVRGGAGTSLAARSAHPSGGGRGAHAHRQRHPTVAGRARSGVSARRLRAPSRVLRPSGHDRRGP